MNDVQQHTVNSREISLSYLFFTFLKIGIVSFGGHMALIAVVKNVMVDKDKRLDHETVLDALSIGSLIPGPLAVNIVAYIGYSLKKTAGAFVSMLAILLPATLCMLLLSWLYFTFGYNQKLNGIMPYVTGAVSAIILSTGVQLYGKEIKRNILKISLCLLGIVGVVLSKNFLVPILLICVGGNIGWLCKMSDQQQGKQNDPAATWKLHPKAVLIVVCLLGILFLFLSNAQQYIAYIPAKLAVIFSGISLSLFGGGYVMIPIMQSLFVGDLGWLSQQEFMDAIAFSQATPGPILVSATFIGYKMYGLAGALIGTIAIFTPSAVLMILVSRIYGNIRHLATAKNILAGVKAVVIGLIMGAAVKIGQQISWNFILILITLIAFVLSFRYKINPVYIILSALAVGVIVWYAGV